MDGIIPTTVSNNTTQLNVETNGAVTNADITITQQMENPSGAVGYPAEATRSAGAFVEVNASPELRANLKQIYVRVNYNPAELPAGTDESSLRLYLWDTALGSWSLVPGSGVNTTEHYIYGTATHLSKFGGFGTAAAQQAPPPPPPASGGGGGGIGIVVEVTGLSGITSLVLDATGACQGTTHLTTADNVASLYIRIGDKMHNAKGTPLSTLKVSAATSPYPPPAQTAIIAAYNFDPDGATFNPGITLIMTYDPAKLPKGAKESELYLASSNGTEWQALESTVDTAARTVSAKVGHFTQFALLSKLAPASFALSAFSVTPTQVKPDEMVTIQTVVTNNGGSPGKYNAVLKVNGAEVNNRELVLSANKSETAVFKVMRSIPGKYTVDVNGNTGEFTVTVPPAPSSPAPLATPRAEPTPAATPAPTPAAPQPTPGPNWALIWGIGGVVVAGAILWLVMRRRFMA